MSLEMEEAAWEDPRRIHTAGYSKPLLKCKNQGPSTVHGKNEIKRQVYSAAILKLMHFPPINRTSMNFSKILYVHIQKYLHQNKYLEFHFHKPLKDLTGATSTLSKQCYPLPLLPHRPSTGQPHSNPALPASPSPSLSRESFSDYEGGKAH